MEATWRGSIQIDAPIDRVYRYLADFPRHCEWAQTLDRMEQLASGDPAGVGARYRTFERQGLQHNRQPHQPLTDVKGMKATTICEVRELVPDRRIAWHAYAVPRMGLRADLAFEFAPARDGGTTLTQRIVFHQPDPMRFILRRVIFKISEAELAARGEAQWDASLRNIKAIVEEQSRRAPRLPATA